MIIAARYSFCDGEKIIASKYPTFLKEIESCISQIDAKKCKTKIGKETTNKGVRLYSPVSLNNRFKKYLIPLGWEKKRVKCDYPLHHYVEGYDPKRMRKGAFREIDFLKEKLGVEVQFGKYSFMVYNVAAKMTIFRNLKYINMGIEIVPVKALASEMSSGVSYFEQFVWDLEQRGESNIDIPVLILGIDVDV